MINTFQNVLNEGLSMFNLQPSVRVVSVSGDNRVTLSYTQDPKYQEFHPQMIRLEGFMRNMLNTNIELRLENKEDRNKRDAKSERL